MELSERLWINGIYSVLRVTLGKHGTRSRTLHESCCFCVRGNEASETLGDSAGGPAVSPN